jgi:hypothetical protein
MRTLLRVRFPAIVVIAEKSELERYRDVVKV